MKKRIMRGLCAGICSLSLIAGGHVVAAPQAQANIVYDQTSIPQTIWAYTVIGVVVSLTIAVFALGSAALASGNAVLSSQGYNLLVENGVISPVNLPGFIH